MTREQDELARRASRLGLYGILAHWDELKGEPWLRTVIEYEEQERAHRSLERRRKNARVGAFKPIADFDWKHPTKIDRRLVTELFSFEFLTYAINPIIIGPNGTGKSLIAKNLIHEAVLKGHTALFTSASAMLNDLAAQDGPLARKRRFRRYTSPGLLCIDEVGYLSYDSSLADLLFEVVTQRYAAEASIIITTNRPFSEWNEVFPNAACVATLVDRLCHRAELIQIVGSSYRVKEAKERTKKRRARRTASKTTKAKTTKAKTKTKRSPRRP
ncbi:MAG: AAA family ATPase [Myxococcales bacterium FL481]|nr:MAG: AAA family ATPase [Myxococcales bacterium FL481]